MPQSKINFDTVRRIGLALPGVREELYYGAPAIKAGGRLVACIPTHKSAEPESLVVRTSFERRAEMLAEDPEVYYLKPHYENFPVVLVRLSRIHADALRDLLKAAWQFASSKEARPQKRSVRTRRITVPRTDN
jgi:hypothetical protein